MASLRMRLSLIILSLLFPVPHDSFVIRKRSINYDFMPTNDLAPSDWIAERPRDTLLRDPYAEPYGGVGGGALDGERQLALELLLEHPEEDYEDEDEDVPEDRMSLIPEADDEDEEEVEEDARVGGGGAAKLVDKSELEDLFEKAAEKKKTPDVDLGGKSSSKSSELTKDDVERLLSPGSTGEMRKVVTETKILVSASNGSDAQPSYEGVRVVEVAEKDSNGATRRQKQTEWLTDPDQDKNGGGGRGEGEQPAGGRGWLGDVIGETEKEDRAPTRKVKRSEMSTVEDLVGGERRASQEEVEEEEEEEEREAEDVELLKAYIRLQTEENRHLEKALNLAITTQVEDSDAYLGDEVGQLRMAVENEEELETIRDAIRGRQTQEEEEEEEEDGGRPSQEEEEAEEEDGGNSSQGEEEEAEEEEEAGGDEEEEEDNEISRQLLKAKLKKFLIDSAVNDISDGEGYADDVDEDEEEEEEEEEDQDRRGMIVDQYRYGKPTVLNPFTRNALVESRTNKRNPMGLVADLESDDLSRATNDLDITELLGTPDATELGYCPAVRELTDDCLAARADGLILDAEAVSLCNRHQICYYCGSVFGMTSDSCDGGYLGESEQLCLGEEKCTKEAAGLYLIMAKTHQFISSPKLAPYVCAAACVYDYVIGLADERR